MALTKGVGFTNVRSFVTERFGPGAWNEVASTFESADRDVLTSVAEAGWYDLELYARLIRAVDRRYGGGDLKLVQAIGRYEAEQDLTAIRQFFLKLFRVTIALESVGKYWSRFHDTGTWQSDVKEREAVGLLSDWGVVDEALCRELVGYLPRTLELLGAQDVTIEHPRCRAHGASVCEFRSTFRLKKDGPALAETGTPTGTEKPS